MNMFRRAPLFIFLITLLSLSLTGCGPNEESVRVNLDRRINLSAPKRGLAITYAYLPQYTHATSFERHRKLLDYLRKETGLPLRQIFPDTFDEHVEMVRRGEIDISFSNPFIYSKLAKFGARAFARTVEPSGQPYFQGQIIARSNNPAIKDIRSCRGKRWIAVDPGSAGGFLFPLGLFAEHGITLGDFDEVAFAPGPGGKQEKVVLAVLAGAYDIGTIRKGTLNVVADRIDLNDIKIVGETQPFPGWVYAARKGLDQAIVDTIATAMFTMDFDDPDHRPILEAARFRGIIPAQDADYEQVRDLSTRLNLEGTR